MQKLKIYNWATLQLKELISLSTFNKGFDHLKCIVTWRGSIIICFTYTFVRDLVLVFCLWWKLKFMRSLNNWVNDIQSLQLHSGANHYLSEEGAATFLYSSSSGDCRRCHSTAGIDSCRGRSDGHWSADSGDTRRGTRCWCYIRWGNVCSRDGGWRGRRGGCSRRPPRRRRPVGGDPRAFWSLASEGGSRGGLHCRDLQGTKLTQ